MFRKVLIANRGAIACRIVRTLRRMGIGSVAVYSEADRHSQHVAQADESACIGPAPAAQSYLSAPAILQAARTTGAEAIHPGYGFLSESADFAEACAAAGVRFIGPAPGHMRVFGRKHTARLVAQEQRVPLLPGTALLPSSTEAIHAAARIGYPVMLKSTAGGGGIGMRLCASAAELCDAFESVRRQSEASFGSSGVYLEKFVARARHIEVQIFGDGDGNVLALGERDCSAQRRNQKVIEETPAPGITPATRTRLFDAAIRMAKSVGYESAGTVEFLLDSDTGAFFFLEVNTRLQVEHGVTEEVTGVDLVEWMVRQAAGDRDFPDAIRPQGCAIQARLYAEDPARNFQPSSGLLSQVHWPDRARVETWVESGTEVTPYYDPMLAKIIVRGNDRATALLRLRAALADCRVAGIETNLAYLRQVCDDPAFENGAITTAFLSGVDYRRRAVEVLDPGTQTTIQDYPGRLGYWNVGVPPSGPMDAFAFRLANRLAGNSDSAAALEIAVTGPSLRFECDTVVAITGADFDARINGQPAPRWRSIAVKAGSILEFGVAQSCGARAYVAVAGGFDVPEYLGSRSTFILGKFGGHAGRVLRAGDVLHLGAEVTEPLGELPQALIPRYGNNWEIGTLYGPHGAPDFFTPADVEVFFATAWKVHHNSDRTGVRLIGPKPQWARKDGGEAGLHPSNIHDNPYSIGAVDFTGDMPVILGPDGPSLGGFVCLATIVHGELWKVGQLRPGDSIRFRALSLERATALDRDLEHCIATLDGELPRLPENDSRSEPIILDRAPAVVCRASGDRALLIEYGPNVLDLNLRLRVHALESQLRDAALPGIIDITPGVRSLHVHYDAGRLPREALLEALDHCEQRIPALDQITAPSRIVHLPLSWDDPATRLAIQKYTQSVRPDAPWCPSNIEFIRRINGLDSIDDVHAIVYHASYLVLGLGDVYLGAPAATPTDPRHRLVTTKYNPARMWTPENAVGIGGAYMCIYGMESPGGYQLVGRTLQIWNTYRSAPPFDTAPWLLRFFDQVRYFPVSAAELLEMREAFSYGGYSPRIEPSEFRLQDYNSFLTSIAAESATFKHRQHAAFLEERERWALSGADKYSEPAVADILSEADNVIPEGCRPVRSPVTASVWTIAIEPGQRVEAGQKLLVLEAMKMEIAVAAPGAGIVQAVTCKPGAMVFAGQHLVTLRQEIA